VFHGVEFFPVNTVFLVFLFVNPGNGGSRLGGQFIPDNVQFFREGAFCRNIGMKLV